MVKKGCKDMEERMLEKTPDYFNVTEDFMRKAVCFYIHGNLAAELYF